MLPPKSEARARSVAPPKTGPWIASIVMRGVFSQASTKRSKGVLARFIDHLNLFALYILVSIAGITGPPACPINQIP